MLNAFQWRDNTSLSIKGCLLTLTLYPGLLGMTDFILDFCGYN